MNDSAESRNEPDNEPVEITVRIPGTWEHPAQLVEQLPPGVQITEGRLKLPDGTEFEVTPLPPDDQFATIFRKSCRGKVTEEEFSKVDNYTVNVCLSGPGGSMESAYKMMQAAELIMRAGGAAVFIDNSALAHGASQWCELVEAGNADALTFGYVSIVRGADEVYTMGMQTLGYPEVLMSRKDADADEMSIIEVMRYFCESDRRIDAGHVLADEKGPRFQVTADTPARYEAGSPLHNPWGRVRLVSFRDIAESN